MWRAFARLFHVRLFHQEKFALYKSFCSHLRYTKFVFGLTPQELSAECPYIKGDFSLFLNTFWDMMQEWKRSFCRQEQLCRRRPLRCRGEHCEE